MFVCVIYVCNMYMCVCPWAVVCMVHTHTHIRPDPNKPPKQQKQIPKKQERNLFEFEGEDYSNRRKDGGCALVASVKCSWIIRASVLCVCVPLFFNDV